MREFGRTFYDDAFGIRHKAGGFVHGLKIPFVQCVIKNSSVYVSVDGEWAKKPCRCLR